MPENTPHLDAINTIVTLASELLPDRPWLRLLLCTQDADPYWRIFSLNDPDSIIEYFLDPSRRPVCLLTPTLALDLHSDKITEENLYNLWSSIMSTFPIEPPVSSMQFWAILSEGFKPPVTDDSV